MSGNAADIHNDIVGPIVVSIVKPVLESGGDGKQILVVTESVLTGVILAITKLGGDEVVLDELVVGVKARLAEIRLTDAPTSGSA